MNKKKKSLSICLLALNEEKYLEKTTIEIYGAAKSYLDEFEIIIIDDGSIDNTYKIATELKEKLGSEIKIIRNEKNKGIGPAFLKGTQTAACENIVGFPADGAFLIEGIEKLFQSVGDADVILGYRTNLHERPPLRYFLSSCVNAFVSLIVWKKLKDSEGNIIMPLHLCKKFNMKLAKYNFHMQMVCFILNHQITYKEVSVIYAKDADNHSGMVHLPVLLDVIFSSLQVLFLKVTGRLKFRR